MDEKQKEELLGEQYKFAQMGQQVLNNEAYKSAITIRKAHLFDVFSHTTHDQADIREEAWRTMQNLAALEQYFNEVLTTGMMAEEQLSQLQKLSNK